MLYTLVSNILLDILGAAKSTVNGLLSYLQEWFERKRYRMNLDGTAPATSSHSIRNANKSQSGKLQFTTQLAFIIIVNYSQL